MNHSEEENSPRFRPLPESIQSLLEHCNRGDAVGRVVESALCASRNIPDVVQALRLEEAAMSENQLGDFTRAFGRLAKDRSPTAAR